MSSKLSIAFSDSQLTRSQIVINSTSGTVHVKEWVALSVRNCDLCCPVYGILMNDDS